MTKYQPMYRVTLMGTWLSTNKPNGEWEANGWPTHAEASAARERIWADYVKACGDGWVAAVPAVELFRIERM